jgi:hypothetical protein
VDEFPDLKRRVKGGEVIIQPLTGKGSKEISQGMIHDWIGVVFIPGVALEKTLARVHDYDNHKNLYKPEVIDSKLLKRDGDHFRVYLRLLKKKVITVVLDTQHEVQGYPLSGGRRHSRSHTTSVAEVENAGRPDERKLPEGKDHGFVWRLNSYWRFQERDGGVWIECEAISLSRDIPTGLGWLIEPIVRGLPSESLANTLACTCAAGALVLLGDPQQLEQPQQAHHPDGVDISALNAV